MSKETTGHTVRGGRRGQWRGGEWNVATDRDTQSADEATARDGATIEELHRLVLQARVASLEAQLEHKERQLTVIRRQYERALEERDPAQTDDESGVLWLG